MLDVFARSNTYRALHSMYEELGAYGTSASIIVDDFDSVIHHHTLTAGEYAIASDYRGKVQTLYREFDLTVAQMVGEFGRDKVSPAVRTFFDRGNLDTWVPVIHAIEPRIDRDATKRDAQNMAWKSVYFEPGCEAAATCPSPASSNSGAGAALGGLRRRHLRQQPGHGSAGRHPPTAARAAAQGAGHRLHDEAPAAGAHVDEEPRPGHLPGGVSFVDTARPQAAFARPSRCGWISTTC